MDTRQAVKDYYGKELQDSKDLKTDACCAIETMEPRIRKLLANIEDEVLMKFYGCGSPMPDAMEGLTVLDLGCGTGRDVYLAAQLVGESGQVIGVDMTDEQLDVARKYESTHAEKFGYKQPNTSFRKGYIEDLSTAGIEDNSIDLVISNCVVNLAQDKEAVLREIFRVLKPGGELYFSDVYANRRIPNELRNDPVLYGECLSGALYIEDFRRMMAKLGCPDYRVVKSRKMQINNEAVAKKLANVRFDSITIRAFKLADIEDRCEDYGQVATYLGNCPQREAAFTLDDHHTFEAGKPETVCGNTAAMLEETRFSEYFEITGNRAIHYGLYNCKHPTDTIPEPGPGACC